MSEQKNSSILDKILARKLEEVHKLKMECPLADFISDIEHNLPVRDFQACLKRSYSDFPAVIAEVKKASPSRGVIRQDFAPCAISQSYEAGGARAISVLTDADFFQGSLSYLADIKKTVQLPVLRKDFIIDAYQIYEARSAGADAILLIVAALESSELNEFLELAHNLGLQCLVEVHDEVEMEIAISVGARIVGINNRDLNTFKTNLDTTQRLIRTFFSNRNDKTPILVSESGIFSRSDMLMLGECGVDAVLIGEALMRESDIESKLRELIG